MADWKTWAKVIMATGDFVLSVQAERTKKQRKATEAAAEDEAMKKLTLQARKLEGRWVSRELQMECEVTQPDLISPAILIELQDSQGRMRAVAPVLLKPLLFGVVSMRRRHDFIALTGTNLAVKEGTEVSGGLEIDDDLKFFTLILYQLKESSLNAPKEALRGTFYPKRAIAAG